MTINKVLPELTTRLKTLGLSGMLNSLESRRAQAVSNQMSHCDFLSLLVSDEILLRDNRRYERRLRQANLSGYKTIENFDFTFNPKLNQALIRDLATCLFIREKYPVLIVGPCGTGKSHLAQALGFCAIKQGFDVVSSTQGQIADLLQSAKATGSYEKKLKLLSKVPLLIIDDFGLKPLKLAEEEVLHDLINQRYEQTSTMITSNLSVSEWCHAFNNKLLGAAMIDRLQHNAYSLILDGKSYRTSKTVEKKGGLSEKIYIKN